MASIICPFYWFILISNGSLYYGCQDMGAFFTHVAIVLDHADGISEVGGCVRGIVYPWFPEFSWGHVWILPLWWSRRDKESPLIWSCISWRCFSIRISECVRKNDELFQVIRKCAFIKDKYIIDIWLYSFDITKEFIWFGLEHISRNHHFNREDVVLEFPKFRYYSRYASLLSV